MSEQNAVDLKQVYLSLEGNAGKIEILHSIDLRITQGSSCALVGPSGSGKSSLLMVMAGLEKATRGRVCVCWGRIFHPCQKTNLRSFGEAKSV